MPLSRDIQQRAPQLRRYLLNELQRKGTMPTAKGTRDLARSLIAREADASTAFLQSEPASVRVYERLRRQLGAPVGAEGFQSLATRALALARSESPRLRAVQVTANGDLRGFGEIGSQTDPDEDGEAGIILIAQLLGLFLTLLGEATTLRLMEDLRVQAEIVTKSVATSADKANSVSEDLVIAAVFGDLLVEIDKLRKVSGSIEYLAGKHPGMEEGLLSAAASVRSIATVLDVFTLIRSKAGGSEGDEPDLQTNRYMN